MSQERNASKVFEEEFPLLRAKIIEIAAILDRVGRAGEDALEQERCKQVSESIRVLLEDAPDRVERIQTIFSLPYDPDWKKTLGVG